MTSPWVSPSSAVTTSVHGHSEHLRTAMKRLSGLWLVAEKLPRAKGSSAPSGPRAPRLRRTVHMPPTALSSSESGERTLLPPREERGHVARDLEREPGGPLLEEGRHPLTGVIGAAPLVDGPRVDLVRLHRVIGA